MLVQKSVTTQVTDSTPLTYGVPAEMTANAKKDLVEPTCKPSYVAWRHHDAERRQAINVSCVNLFMILERVKH